MRGLKSHLNWHLVFNQICRGFDHGGLLYTGYSTVVGLYHTPHTVDERALFRINSRETGGAVAADTKVQCK